MEVKLDNIIYTENISAIIDSAYNKDWCAHVLCKKGTFAMIFNRKLITIESNQLFVSQILSLISALQPGPEGCEVEIIMARTKFLQNQLPVNNYSIEGGISLYENPVIVLDEKEVNDISKDFQSIRCRLADTVNPFSEEISGSLCRVMMYDIFAAHIRRNDANRSTTNIGANLINQLLSLLGSGLAKKHRNVEFYAEKLCVSPKYLSNFIKRHTGQTVTELINRHALPILSDYLQNTTMTLNQICQEMNFSSPSYLSRYIHKNFGLSPTDYRKKSISTNN